MICCQSCPQLICRNQFKARPVNAKILNNSGIGVKKVAPKPPTEPEAFALSTGIQKKKESEKEQYEFHANPVNKKILEGPVVWFGLCVCLTQWHSVSLEATAYVNPTRREVTPLKIYIHFRKHMITIQFSSIFN